MEDVIEEKERKFKDTSDSDLMTTLDENFIQAREVLSLLYLAAQVDIEEQDFIFSVPPITLIGDTLEKLADAQGMSRVLCERYRPAEKIIQESPEFKKFKKMKESAN